MFGHDSLPSKIYRYGIPRDRRYLSAATGTDLVIDQIHKMHKYRNELVRAELDRREAVNAATRRLRPRVQELTDECAALESAVEQLLAAVRSANAASRSRTGTPEQRAEKRRLNERLRAARAELREVRREAFVAEDVRASLDEIEEADGRRRRTLRAASGLYWGNYLVVEQAAGSFRRGAPPRFYPWRGPEGRVAVQLQGGLAVADLLSGGDSRMRLERGWPDWANGRGRERTLLIRVGTNPDRSPVFATFPVVYHRDLPADGVVKWAYLHHRRRGTAWRWELSVVVSRAGGWPRPDAAASGVVGIDLGWRLVPEGLRVAYWVGGDGRKGQLVIPHADLGRWSHANETRGVLDTDFGAVRDHLARWLGSHAAPEWLADRTRYLTRWKSPDALAALFLRWERERFAGDEAIHDGLRRWFLAYHRDRDSEAGERSRAVRWRDDLYRNFVVELRRQYRAAHVEPRGTWASLARLPQADSADGINETARFHRTVAACGRLAQLVREGFAEFVEVEAAHTTTTCCDCGTSDPFDAEAELVRVCEWCGAERDQDERAAINLLRQMTLPPSDATNPARGPDQDTGKEVA